MGLPFSACVTHGPMALWALSSVAGFSLLALYANSPSPQTVPERSAPWEAFSGTGAQLRVFIHPECVCSQASLRELREVMAEAGDRVDELRFIVTAPTPGSDEDWSDSAQLKDVFQWGDGATVRLDPGGEIASQYGALSSGHVVARDAQGRLLFTGGITGSRGHSGDNPNRRALIESLLQGESRADAPVFGCGLQSS